ncbi:MAG TPA: hypothetical protein VF584_07470 [Longimicrobium sp.]|jgi:hypothetical protein
MPAAYDRSVFINCPFDDRYRPLFHAIVFAVHDCGFLARCALELEDSGEERIRKIKRIIRECQYGVHDISRVQLDSGTGLPRFNMPLELGLFLGAQEYGDAEQTEKRSLILDAEQYRYQAFCSDIAGQDIRAHGNEPKRAVSAVRGMLATALAGTARVPGEAKILSRFNSFRKALPGFCEALHVRVKELQFAETRSFVEEWITRHPL